MDISIEHAVASYFSQWLVAHPYLAWTISHPLPSLGLLLLTIFSLWGLIKAIGQGIEQMWLFLLKTPFKLLLTIFRPIWGLIRRIFGHTNSSKAQIDSPLTLIPLSEKIESIIDRLQILNREQEILLSELANLKGSTSVISENRSRSDTQYKDL